MPPSGDGKADETTRKPVATARPSEATRRTEPAPPPASPGSSQETHRLEGQAKRGSGTLINLPSALSGDYDIVRQLPTRGGEADILLVRSRAKGEERIVKLYRMAVEPRSEILEQLRVADPRYVIGLFDHGKSDGIWYELQEYAPHGSLADLTNQRGGKLAPDEVRTILAQLREALVFLHGLDPRIVHRDLKPSNILVRRVDPLELVLADFGIARNLDFSSRLTAAHRTSLYAPPEAQTEPAEISPQYDWWSLGVTIVELLTGRHPYAAPSEAEASLRAGKPVDLQGLWRTPELREPSDWARLCRGLLQIDLKERWGANEIDHWLAGEAVALPQASEEWLRTGEWRIESRAAEPFRIGDRACATAAELAAAMRDHWDLACRDIARVSALDHWLTQKLGNHNASRWLHDLNDDPSLRSLDASGKLSLFLTELDPSLPPLIGGRELTPEGFRALAQAAGGRGAGAWPSVLRPQFGELLAKRTKAAWLAEAYAAWSAAAQAARKLDDAMRRLGPQLAPLMPEGDLSLLDYAIDREVRDRFFQTHRGDLNSRALKACPWTAPALPADPKSAANLWVWSQRLAPALTEGRAREQKAARDWIERRKRLLIGGGIAAVILVVGGSWLDHSNRCAAQSAERRERREQHNTMEGKLISYVDSRKREQAINAEACRYAHHVVFAPLSLDQHRANMKAILHGEASPYRAASADEIASVERKMRDEDQRARADQTNTWYVVWITSSARFANLPNAGAQCTTFRTIDFDGLEAAVIEAEMPAPRYADVKDCSE
jgi:serine/threonine protein kinase